VIDSFTFGGPEEPETREQTFFVRGVPKSSEVFFALRA
jgi:hypothetical protein